MRWDGARGEGGKGSATVTETDHFDWIGEVLGHQALAIYIENKG